MQCDVEVIFLVGDAQIHSVSLVVEQFEEMLTIITPPQLRSVGLPFMGCELYDLYFIRQIYHFLCQGKHLTVLLYTSQFIDKIVVRNYCFPTVECTTSLSVLARNKRSVLKRKNELREWVFTGMLGRCGHTERYTPSRDPTELEC
jgi:hypothetical protein